MPRHLSLCLVTILTAISQLRRVLSIPSVRVLQGAEDVGSCPAHAMVDVLGGAGLRTAGRVMD
jgi:hypothetical protein